MIPSRFQTITEKYSKLRVAVVGDFCLDRYLEIDPRKEEVSIETGLPVHNVINVRSQPGGAGTILNNLVALGIGEVWPVGFCGDDGEGYELRRALGVKQGVRLDHFLSVPERRTFTYCKPLVVTHGKPPVELNRLDSKNWTPTPAPVQTRLADAVSALAGEVDAMILLDQVDVSETGVITARLLETVSGIVKERPDLLILADSRRGLRGFPSVSFKMNSAELAFLAGKKPPMELEGMKLLALDLARRQGRNVFVTLAEQGILGASPNGDSEHVPALPVRGEIDIVGAGDAVTANLTVALAAGATLGEALEIANAAASIVIHQLGTTGTADVGGIGKLVVREKVCNVGTDFP
jgi:rfaE bifunctional protein kinase chain/domain